MTLTLLKSMQIAPKAHGTSYPLFGVGSNCIECLNQKRYIGFQFLFVDLKKQSYFYPSGSSGLKLVKKYLRRKETRTDEMNVVVRGQNYSKFDSTHVWTHLVTPRRIGFPWEWKHQDIAGTHWGLYIRRTSKSFKKDTNLPSATLSSPETATVPTPDLQTQSKWRTYSGKNCNFILVVCILLSHANTRGFQYYHSKYFYHNTLQNDIN